MTRSRTLATIGLSATLLLAGVPASAAGAAYSHYVGCGLTKAAKPAHACAKSSKKGAFFESRKADVLHSVCLKPPAGRTLCANAQRARAGQLKVNRITATTPGRYVVTWFVDGKHVGSFAFRVGG